MHWDLEEPDAHIILLVLWSILPPCVTVLTARMVSYSGCPPDELQVHLDILNVQTKNTRHVGKSTDAVLSCLLDHAA